MSNPNAIRRLQGNMQPGPDFSTLSRPTVSLTRDPMNWSGLKSDPELLKLDYPTTSWAMDNRWPSRFGTTTVLLFWVLVLRWLVAFAPGPSQTILLIVVLAAASFRLLRARGEDPFFCVAPFVFAAVVWLPSALLCYALLYPVAMCAVVRFSDRFANHVTHYLLARPEVRPRVREDLKRVWRQGPLWQRLGRGIRGLCPDPQNEVEAREQPVRASYEQWLFGLPALSYVVGLIVAVAALLRGVPEVLAAAVGFLAAMGVVLVRLGGTGNPFKHEVHGGSFLSFLSLWFGYNKHGAVAPGLWRSPEGDAHRRASSYTAAAATMVAVTLVSASFFPVPVAAVSVEAWEESVLPLSMPPPPSAGLTAEEKRVLESLDNKEGTAYVVAKHNARLEAHHRQVTAEALAPLQSRPEMWLRYVPELVAETGPRTIFWATLALLLSLTLPSLFFFLFVCALTQRRLAHHWASCMDEGAPYHSKKTPVQSYVDRIRNSFERAEERPIWIGLNEEQDYPVLLDRELLALHAHIMGSTGSGKTAAAASIVSQLADRDANDSIVIIDLKGDNALFQEARESARRMDADFKWYTNESGQPTYAFNPLTQRQVASMTPLEKTEHFMKPLGLEYPEAYGSSFYMSQNREALQKLLTHRPETETLRELAALFQQASTLFTPEELKNASHLKAVATALAAIDSLNVGASAPANIPVRARKKAGVNKDQLKRELDPLDGATRSELLENAIQMQDASDETKRPQVIYFRLRAALGGMTLREIGKFALHGLITGATMLPKEQRRRVWVFIDEFQEVVSRDIQIFFKQARELKIAAILANQSSAQLQEASPVIVPELAANTNTQLVFSVHDPAHRAELRDLSGETFYHLATQHPPMSIPATMNHKGGSRPMGLAALRQIYRGGVGEQSFREALGPRINTNDLIDIGANSELCLATFKQNMGYTAFDGLPFKVRTEFHITEEKFRKRERKGLPAGLPGTCVAPFEPTKELTPQQPDSPMARLRERARERTSE